MTPLGWNARPPLWRMVLTPAVLVAAWILLIEGWLHPRSLEAVSMWTRLNAWLTPPLLFALVLLLGQWLLASTRVQAAEQAQQQAQARQDEQARQAQAAAAQALAQQQFSLEVRSIGITLDKYRQMQIWQRLDKVNQPYQSMLSQNPEDYEQFSYNRDQQSRQRRSNMFETALNGWVERWPIPILIAGPGPEHPARHLSGLRQGTGLGITLFAPLDEAIGATASASLSEQLFAYFDQHPELPAVVVVSRDDVVESRIKRDWADVKMVPSLLDSYVAMVVSRTDRVDRDIRPYLVDVPYEINLEHTQYDIIKLWNFYWAAQSEFRSRPENKSLDSIRWLPWQAWQVKQQELIARIDPNAGQGSLLAFWDRGKAGFKPNPWVPVRWTQWQMDQYDDAPIMGYLHRPIKVAFVDDKGTSRNDTDKAHALAQGWRQALATLPDGSPVSRLIYDTGSDAKRIIPLARAMAEDGLPQAVSTSDAASSYNLSQRIGNLGVSSPLTQWSLAVMRSYTQGGVSATVDLRDPAQARILMVSPPSEEQKARHMKSRRKKTYAPIYNDYGPNNGRNLDPFFSKVQ